MSNPIIGANNIKFGAIIGSKPYKGNLTLVDTLVGTGTGTVGGKPRHKRNRSRTNRSRSLRRTNRSRKRHRTLRRSSHK